MVIDARSSLRASHCETPKGEMASAVPRGVAEEGPVTLEQALQLQAQWRSPTLFTRLFKHQFATATASLGRAKSKILAMHEFLLCRPLPLPKALRRSMESRHSITLNDVPAAFDILVNSVPQSLSNESRALRSKGSLSRSLGLVVRVRSRWDLTSCLSVRDARLICFFKSTSYSHSPSVLRG